MPDLAHAYLEQARTKRTDHWSGPPGMVERIARALETQPEHLVIDVGCGIGGPARRLAETVGCRVVGIDVVGDVLRIAAKRRTRGVRFVAGDAAAVPIRDALADQVWSLGSVAHVDVAVMASEVRRILRPGGLVAVTEVFWEGRGTPRFAETAPRPWNAVTVSGLMSAFQSAGLVGIRALPWPGRGMGRSGASDDPELARDLREGRLVPALVVAERPEA
ncbi:MAG: class I SAM-dependent methyltransferase [Actinomycetota bacterium]